MNLKNLSATEFEGLVYDLMLRMGFRNCVWRTPGRDSGRDIQGVLSVQDISGFSRNETWYVECKKYQGTVSWPLVWEKISYAESNSADFLLVVTSSRLSPQAIDEVEKWNSERRGLKVRYWSKSNLEIMLKSFPDISIKYGLLKNPIKEAAVSILQLTLMLAKYANLVFSNKVFLNKEGNEVEVLHSISELISARVDEIHKTERIGSVPFSSARDCISFAVDEGLLERTKLDKYFLRALLEVLAYHSRPSEIIVSSSYERLTIIYGFAMNDALLADLHTMANWGSARIIGDTTRNYIEVEHA